ncbi:MAG: histidine phosphatase family protein [Treponema sp.]|nr:histidine phosphatase family protein [Treponema sp.]
MKNRRIFCGFLLTAFFALVSLPVFAGGGKEKAVTIYVTQHGKTLFNTKELVQGWVDSPLTVEGIAMVEDLGRALRDVPFDYVISSDLIRARQTARLVMAQNRASKNYQAENTEALREACFGQFEGEPNSIMAAAFTGVTGMTAEDTWRDPYMWLRLADAVKQLDTTGISENAATIKKRMQEKLVEVAEAQAKKGGNVLLVAHGMSINIMLSDIDPSFTYTGTPLENASVCKVVYQGGKFSIESFNDTSYIGKGRALHP